MSSQPELLDTLKEAGALKEGHFLLASGRHSDRYIEKFDLLRQPLATSAALVPLAEQFRPERIDVVVGPTTGGIILAFELGRQLGVRSAYAERMSDDSPGREFRRGTTFLNGDRVLVLDDILTTGGSIRDTLVALDTLPVDVVGVSVLVDRSAGGVTFGEIPLVPLVSLDVESWEANACPMCADGIPLTKPGTSTPVQSAE